MPDVQPGLGADARRVLLRAEQEAARRNHPQTDVDHLLLALLLEDSGAARALAAAEIESDYLRNLLDGARRVGAPELSVGPPGVHPRVTKVVKVGVQEAGTLGHDLTSELLLLVLLKDADAVTRSLLELVGIADHKGPRREVLEALAQASTQAPTPMQDLSQAS